MYIYSNTYSTIKIKLVDVYLSTYIDFNKENKKENSKFLQKLTFRIGQKIFL